MTLKETTKRMFSSLPRRAQEVLERRFGFGRSEGDTLEAVGRSYGITRERVRQIEAHGLGMLQKPDPKKLLGPFVKEARAYFERYGGLRRRETALEDLGRMWGESRRQNGRTEFVLEASREFLHQGETPTTFALWALDAAAVKRANDFVRALVGCFKEERRPASSDVLSTSLAKVSQRLFGKATPSREALTSYLETTKLIRRNPFGLWGLASWPEISPRGIRDWAYLTFFRLGRPLHFRDLAHQMNKLLKLKRPAHEQTVHNELIKDVRFVLVGRGIYGLKEWGYEAGTVREVLSSILASSPTALGREEIMEKIKRQRMVKENTVFLNLQNRKYFMRLADGRYALNNKKASVTVEKA